MWKDIKECTPIDGERVVVWDNYWDEARILTYYDFYKCWQDDESGDDFEFELDATYMGTDQLRIQYWQSLPTKPCETNIEKD